MFRKLLNAQVLVGSLLSLCSAANAQNNTVSSPGINDVQIAIPARTGVLGRVDAGALQEIAAHLRAVGAIPWRGMQGAGSLTYPSAGLGPFNATLSILGSDSYKLDVQTPQGVRSSRIRGNSGAIQEPDGKSAWTVPETAITGLVQFPMLRLTTFLNGSHSLIDRGAVKVADASFRLITLELPLRTFTTSNKTSAIDLYFDPTTHLLAKSSTVIKINGTRNNNFLRVISYSDYRKVDGTLVPFHYEETLDGQAQWTLQLTEATTDISAIKATDFKFSGATR